MEAREQSVSGDVENEAHNKKDLRAAGHGASHLKGGRESLADRFLRLAKPEADLSRQGYRAIAGIDEAGRGPLAGPVYAAAVILDPERPILGLNDSKRLSEKKRVDLADIIKHEARAWGVGFASAAEIDRCGILPATRLAMSRAIAALEPEPDYLLFDYITGYETSLPADFIKKGDRTANCIAAASILAKVSRDRYMVDLDGRCPGYGFARHKGYGTALHYEALNRLGPSPEHRTCFLRTWREGRHNS